MRIKFHENIRFCPKCGVNAMYRDLLRTNTPKPGMRPCDQGEIGKKQASGTEWVCRLCGFAFLITKSARHTVAEMMFAEERRQRAPVKFSTECVGEEIAQCFVESGALPKEG